MRTKPGPRATKRSGPSPGVVRRRRQITTKSKSPTSPTTVGPRRMERVALQFDLRSERPKWVTFGGGSYVVCVRLRQLFFSRLLFRRKFLDIQEVASRSADADGALVLASVRRRDRRSRVRKLRTLHRSTQRTTGSSKRSMQAAPAALQDRAGPRRSPQPRRRIRSSSAARLGHRGPIEAPVAPAPGPECETRRAPVAGAGRRRLGRPGGQLRHQRRRHGTEGPPRRDEPRNLGHQIRLGAKQGRTTACIRVKRWTRPALMGNSARAHPAACILMPDDSGWSAGVSGSRVIRIAGCARLATGPQPTGYLVDHIGKHRRHGVEDTGGSEGAPLRASRMANAAIRYHASMPDYKGRRSPASGARRRYPRP